MRYALPFLAGLLKTAKIRTPLLPHQQRVVERIQQEDQPGLLVAHGLGSGKTLTSIAAQDALGMPATVITPAALKSNYLKELEKHVEGEPPKAEMASLQAAARRGEIPQNDMLIVDEAHRLREPSTKAYQTIKGAPSKKRLLMTGTPLYNRPFDIAPLINITAGKSVLPADRTKFEQTFLQNEKVYPGLWNRLWGVGPGIKVNLNPKTRERLAKEIQKWVDYHEGGAEGFPTVNHETVRVEMTPHQRDVYDTVLDKAPFWVRAKVRANLPLSKKESQEINAFLSAVRQISNTTGAFTSGRKEEHPKIDVAVANLQKHLKTNSRGGALIYSNYLNSGIDPLKRVLTEKKIPFGEITGEMKKKDRDATVKAYNEGKLRTMLLSSAGGEGLDLKGTRLIQVIEPHWNEEKLKQVEGRGIRLGSHEHLPPEERNVTIQHFIAKLPATKLLERMGVTRPGAGVDEYLTHMSADKARLNQQVKELFGAEKVSH